MRTSDLRSLRLRFGSPGWQFSSPGGWTLHDRFLPWYTEAAQDWPPWAACAMINALPGDLSLFGPANCFRSSAEGLHNYLVSKARWGIKHRPSKWGYPRENVGDTAFRPFTLGIISVVHDCNRRQTRRSESHSTTKTSCFGTRPKSLPYRGTILARVRLYFGRRRARTVPGRCPISSIMGP
jgi:hypothetical protein